MIVRGSASAPAPVLKETKMPEMTPVVSSNLAKVGYDPDTREVHIEFTTGGKYIYENVPPEIYTDMMAAPSIGRFFMQRIKKEFEARKV